MVPCKSCQINSRIGISIQTQLRCDFARLTPPFRQFTLARLRAREALVRRRLPIRFFTIQWWCGIQGGDFHVDPADSYRSHLATIRDRLPEGLLALQESVSLHDGRLRELQHAPSNATLRLLIDGDDSNGGLRRFTLYYRDVTLFRSIADPCLGLPGPCGYGDLGYDEADMDDNGELIHRILFSSGIEFHVQFKGFELAWRDIAEPNAAPDRAGM